MTVGSLPKGTLISEEDSCSPSLDKGDLVVHDNSHSELPFHLVKCTPVSLIRGTLSVTAHLEFRSVFGLGSNWKGDLP